MSHLLQLDDIKAGQIVHVALERNEGRFLNQDFPAIPKECFWLGGILEDKTKNNITIELKAFRDLITIDIDVAMKGNTCIIPAENIEKMLFFSGTVWIFLRS